VELTLTENARRGRDPAHISLYGRDTHIWITVAYGGEIRTVRLSRPRATKLRDALTKWLEERK